MINKKILKQLWEKRQYKKILSYIFNRNNFQKRNGIEFINKMSPEQLYKFNIASNEMEIDKYYSSEEYKKKVQEDGR